MFYLSNFPQTTASSRCAGPPSTSGEGRRVNFKELSELATSWSHVFEVWRLPSSIVFGPFCGSKMVNIALKSRCFSGAGSSFLSVSFHHFNSQAIQLFNWRFLPIPGWWFGTCFIFHNIWDVILPIDELIFFKMGKTTNQILSG